MRRKWTFSKLLLLLESAVVLYTTYEGFALARLAEGYGYLGTLPWVAATVSAAWGAYGASAGFYYNKAKAENTAGGIVFEAACGRQARSGQDCDGWEERMKELAFKRLTNLFTVKSIVTITLTITFCVLECCGSLSQDYMTIYTAVIGFYFGTQSKKDEDV